MAIIKRDKIKPPVLPREAVPVLALGGDVVVRGMLLSERLALIGSAREQGGAVNFSYIAQVLATCVLAGDDLPVYTAEQWEEFGAQHMGEALALFEKCQALSGLDGEASKKS